MAVSRIRRLINWGSEHSTPPPLILPIMKLDKVQITEEEAKPTDFSLRVENQSMHVHKSVLCAASDYFCVMMKSNMRESNDRVLHIQDMKAKVVKKMIRYFYGKETRLKWKHVTDYLDIVELWQLIQVKAVLEVYITENITPHNCIKWFFYADRYSMELVIQTTKNLIQSNFPEVSRNEDFLSLSLSNLISLISRNDIPHTTILLQDCIEWAQANGYAQRTQELCFLISYIDFSKCNPAILKHLLEQVITDQYIRSQLQDVISSSIIIIGYCTYSLLRKDLPRVRGYYPYYPEVGKMILAINLTSHIVADIRKQPDELSDYFPACRTSDSRIFYRSGSKCALLDVGDCSVTHLPSSTVSYTAPAVAVGHKIFTLVPHINNNIAFHYLDLRQEEWNLSAQTESNPVSSSTPVMAAVDSLILIFLDGGKLLCYDTENNSWSTRADPPVQHHGEACAVAIHKDIYFVGGRILRCLRYNTTNDTWTTIASPPGGYYCYAASVKDRPLLLDACQTHLNKFFIQMYNSNANTWEPFEVIVHYRRIDVRFVCSM